MPESIFCAIRQTWVASLPEERVRQRLIQEMTTQLGYPEQHIALEKGLDQLPHVQLASHHTKISLTRRRADIIVFAKDLHPNHSLYPLLLIECKAQQFSKKALRQLIGYNHYVGAYFVALAHESKTLLGYFDAGIKDYSFIPMLLPYQELLVMAKRG